ncbi:MAG: lysophospholipase [Sphaerochaetaceae bacterium]|nr:lysophospholipase [Sphaerochaetaceae bacterium]
MAEVKYFKCSDSKMMAYRQWIPEDKKVTAVLQILHGMAEHGARYESFAKVLNSKGIAVYVQDHRGHGATIEGDEKGWFADKNGWQRVCDDSYELATFIASNHPGKPLFLFGHSMGSFLARTVMVQHSDLFNGVMIMGTGASQGLIGKIGKLIARRELKKNGPKKPSQKLNDLSFASYNKKFQPSRTDFDWLSRDEEQVDKYIADDLCGFVCTAEFYQDLLYGVELCNSKNFVEKLPKDLPLLIISGSEDPVGGTSKGVKKVYKLYQDAGVADVTLKLVEGARHELLNEINNKEVFEFLYNWMKIHR